MRVCSQKVGKTVIRVTNRDAPRARVFKLTAPTITTEAVIVETTTMREDSVPKDLGWDCNSLPICTHSIAHAAMAMRTLLRGVVDIRLVPSIVPDIMTPRM